MKIEDMRLMGEKEILAVIEENQTLLGNMKYNHAVSPVENPARMRKIKKDIARLKTILNERFYAAQA